MFLKVLKSSSFEDPTGSEHADHTFTRTKPDHFMFLAWDFQVSQRWHEWLSHFVMTSALYCLVCEFTCMSHNIVRHRFAVASLDNQPLRTVVTGGLEVQAFLARHWTKWIPPIRMFAILFSSCYCRSVVFSCITWVKVILMRIGSPYPRVSPVIWIPHYDYKCKCYSQPGIFPEVRFHFQQLVLLWPKQHWPTPSFLFRLTAEE